MQFYQTSNEEYQEWWDRMKDRALEVARKRSCSHRVAIHLLHMEDICQRGLPEAFRPYPNPLAAFINHFNPDRYWNLGWSQEELRELRKIWQFGRMRRQLLREYNFDVERI